MTSCAWDLVTQKADASQMQRMRTLPESQRLQFMFSLPIMLLCPDMRKLLVKHLEGA